MRGHLREGSSASRALAHGEAAPPSVRASALAGDTLVAHSLGDYAAMRRAAERALELYRSAGDERGVAWCCSGSARRSATRAISPPASRWSSRAWGASARSTTSAGSQRLNNLASALLARGDAAAALPLFEESVEVFRASAGRGAARPLSNLGLAALLQGRHAEALRRFDEGVALAAELHYTEAVAYGLEGLAAALSGLGDHARAATLLGAAETAAATVGITLEPLEQRIHEQTVALATGASGRARCADGGARWGEGGGGGA